MRQMEKRRLQFDFTEDALTEMDELQRVAGLSTRADLIRYAVRFLQWATDEVTSNDATLLIEKNGTTRQIVFPFWGPHSRQRRDRVRDTAPANDAEMAR
jgi:hypothetical protein